jgi:phenylacetate-CoA ligase
MGIDDVAPHYQLVVDREDNLDVLTVKVEVGRPQLSPMKSKDCSSLEKRNHQKHQRAARRVSARVKLVEPKAIATQSGQGGSSCG